MGIVKIVILGDSEVGKTSFTTRWTQGTFPDPTSLRTTIGVSFDTKNVTLPSGNNATLSVWDFGGQKRFIESLKSMIRGAKVGILFFDVTHLESLDNLIRYWVPLAEEHGGFNFSEGDGKQFILVGNKIDLLEPPITGVEEDMEYFCSRFGTESSIISARTGLGIEQLDFKFMQMVDDIA